MKKKNTRKIMKKLRNYNRKMWYTGIWKLWCRVHTPWNERKSSPFTANFNQFQALSRGIFSTQKIVRKAKYCYSNYNGPLFHRATVLRVILVTRTKSIQFGMRKIRFACRWRLHFHDGPKHINLLIRLQFQQLFQSKSIRSGFKDGAVFCLGRFRRAGRPAPFWWRPALFKKLKWRPALFWWRPMTPCYILLSSKSHSPRQSAQKLRDAHVSPILFHAIRGS